MLHKAKDNVALLGNPKPEVSKRHPFLVHYAAKQLREREWQRQRDFTRMGYFARLPLELRHRIYEFSINLSVEASGDGACGDHEHFGLIAPDTLSLLVTTRYIYEEMEPLIRKLIRNRETHCLILSKRSVQFEETQSMFDYDDHWATRFFKAPPPNEIPALFEFSQTLSSIRNLRIIVKFDFHPSYRNIAPNLEAIITYVGSLVAKSKDLLSLNLIIDLGRKMRRWLSEISQTAVGGSRRAGEVPTRSIARAAFDGDDKSQLKQMQIIRLVIRGAPPAASFRPAGMSLWKLLYSKTSLAPDRWREEPQTKNDERVWVASCDCGKE